MITLSPKGVYPDRLQNLSAVVELLKNIVKERQALQEMSISSYGVGFIQQHEGLRLRKYKDAAGLYTIGYGHLIKAGENYDSGITLIQASLILKRDLQSVQAAINTLVKVPLTQNQYDALCSLIFNIGVVNFARSTLLQFLNRKQYASAADQFLVWCKCGKPLRREDGLYTRRLDERKLFLKVS